MAFNGPGKPLTQTALDDASQIVGIPGAAIWAVIHVESSGAGYQLDRRPKILFERHKFHKATGGQFDASHAEAGGYPTKLQTAFNIFSGGNLPDIKVRIAQLGLMFPRSRSGRGRRLVRQRYPPRLEQIPARRRSPADDRPDDRRI